MHSPLITSRGTAKTLLASGSLMVVDLRFQCLFAAVVMVGWQCLLLVVWVVICSVVFDILSGRRMRKGTGCVQGLLSPSVDCCGIVSSCCMLCVYGAQSQILQNVCTA